MGYILKLAYHFEGQLLIRRDVFVAGEFLFLLTIALLIRVCRSVSTGLLRHLNDDLI